jgi:hypothetical protein
VVIAPTKPSISVGDSRHVSFIESGRANPSRDMVLLLGRVLDAPLRERNRLLEAAGFVAAYRESKLDASQLVAVTQALDAILAQQRPFPAVVLDRTRNNVLRLIFHAEGLRPHVTNWDEVAPALLQRVHREAVGRRVDDELRRRCHRAGNAPRSASSRSTTRPALPRTRSSESVRDSDGISPSLVFVRAGVMRA